MSPPIRRVGLLGQVARPLLTIAFVLLAACSPSTTPDAESPVPAVHVAPTEPPPTTAQVEEWIAFRRLFGLRADERWVRQVAADPLAARAPIPMLPDEAEAFQDAYELVGDTTEKLKAYGVRFPDTYAGVRTEGRTAVAMFSGNVAEHRAALDLLLGQSVPFKVEERTWSLSQLDTFARRVEADPDWFASRGFLLFDADVSPRDNAVIVLYEGPIAVDPGPSRALEQLAARSLGPWAKLSWVGPVPWKGHRGDLRVRVVGQPPADWYCHTLPLDPLAGEGNVYVRPDRGGVCRFPGLPVGQYRVTLTTTSDERSALTEPVLATVTTDARADVRVPMR
jgi:hypothetical protein